MRKTWSKNSRDTVPVRAQFRLPNTAKLDMSVLVTRKSQWPVENVEVPVERWGELAAFHCRQLCGLAFLLADKAERRRQIFQRLSYLQCVIVAATVAVQSQLVLYISI